MTGRPQSVWITELCVSYKTEQKLIHKHHITLEEVEHAVVRVRGLQGSWDYDDERGWRLLLWVTIRGRRTLVVLYETDEPNVWNLGSAHFRP